MDNVEYVTANDAAKERPDDPVLFALPRAQARALLGMLQQMTNHEEIQIEERVVRELADRVQASYLADRALVASDLSLSFTVLRNTIYLLERHAGGLIAEPNAEMTASTLRILAGRIAAAYRQVSREGKVPNQWKMVETRTEQLN